MKMLQYKLSEKNELSEENRHCQCKNINITITYNSIAEMPFH